jgi:acetylornithine deacetylase
MISLKEKVLNRIEQNRDVLFKDLEEIVRVPSVVGAEGKAQEWVYEKMRSMGLTVETFEAGKDHLVSHPAYINVDWSYQGRPNVIGMIKGKPSPRSIILAGHIDVVSPESITAWKHNPWGGEISGGKM